MTAACTPASPEAVECPRLRDDLVVTQRHTPEGTSYLIRDPRTDRFVRLGDAEHFIAAQFDGLTSLDELRHRAETRFDAPLPLEVLERFVEKLRTLGLLTGVPGQLEESTREPGRVQGTVLQLRVKLIDPDRLLERLLGVLGFCFTPAFVIASVLLILSAVWVAAENTRPLSVALNRMARPEAVVLGLVALFGLAVLHEFAHGLTCKRFGGPVHEIGFLLLYGVPGFYCNVNSAWQIPEKGRRLWVGFAGAYSELLCWAVALLCWRVTQPETGLHSAALLVLAVTGFRTFLNLNPLIKLDGYYLLSDWLEVPNLRERSFRFLAARVRGLFGLTVADEPDVAPRLRRIYLSYGLLAVAFSAGLLIFVTWKVGGFLVSNFQAPGFLVFAVLLIALLRRPLWQMAAGAFTALRAGRLRGWAQGLTVVGVIYSVLFLCSWEQTVNGEFEVLPAERAEVRAKIEGFVDEVCVGEGDRVSAGQVLVRLSNPTVSGELTGTEAEVRRQRAELAKLEAGPTAEQVALARLAVTSAETRFAEAEKQLTEAKAMHTARLERANAAVERAEGRVRFAEGNRARSERSRQSGAGSVEEFERADELLTTCRKECEQARAERKLVREDELSVPRAAQSVAGAERDEAKARLAALLAGTRVEEIEAARAELARLEARRQFLVGQVERTTLVSPITGTVVTRRLREKLGTHVRPGDVVVEVQALDRVRIEIAVPEKEVGDICRDCPVRFKVRAYPGETFPARLESIAPTAGRAGSELGPYPTVLLVAGVENDGQVLKPGMTGTAKVSCGERTIGELVGRRLARLIRVEFWSWW